MMKKNEKKTEIVEIEEIYT